MALRSGASPGQAEKDRRSSHRVNDRKEPSIGQQEGVGEIVHVAATSPPSIFKLQAISIGHRNRLRKVEKDIFALIRNQANAAAMARVKIESGSSCRLFLRPMPGGTMN